MISKRFLSLVLLLTVIISPGAYSQIIADHRAVDDFDKIPQIYIDQVKKMWVNVAGESHAKGYRIGCQLLENSNTDFQVNVKESGIPEGYTDQYMRLSSATWGDYTYSSGWLYNYGEEDWFSNATAISRTKAHLTYCNTNNLQIAAMGFAWCWDMTSDNWPAGTPDPVYQVRWAGRSINGPEGSKRWGLDAGDFALTANSVCMDTYLNATSEYNSYCTANAYPTKVFYTTGPVDASENTGENGYQRSIKHQYIRDFVSVAPERILFDYADILCWSNAGDQKTTSWTDYAGNTQSFQVLHDDNLLDLDGTYTEDGDHIGQRGAVRLAKAMWWMLARMAGWDGNTTGINQPGLNNPFQLFPNPVANILTINLSSYKTGCSLTLSDMSGKELIKQQIFDKSTELDMSYLVSGVYIVGLADKNNIEYRRIVKL